MDNTLITAPLSSTKEDDIVSLKLKFNWLLQPLKVMLIHRKTKLDGQEWEAFVERTKDSVIRMPGPILRKRPANA